MTSLFFPSLTSNLLVQIHIKGIIIQKADQVLFHYDQSTMFFFFFLHLFYAYLFKGLYVIALVSRESKIPSMFNWVQPTVGEGPRDEICGFKVMSFGPLRNLILVFFFFLGKTMNIKYSEDIVNSLCNIKKQESSIGQAWAQLGPEGNHTFSYNLLWTQEGPNLLELHLY